MPLLSKAGFAESSKCDRGACAPSFSAQIRFGEPGAPVLFLLGPAGGLRPLIEVAMSLIAGEWGFVHRLDHPSPLASIHVIASKC